MLMTLKRERIRYVPPVRATETTMAIRKTTSGFEVRDGARVLAIFASDTAAKMFLVAIDGID